MLICTKQSLIDSELEQLKALANECQQYDKHLPELHWHLLKKKSHASSIFYIENKNQFIGFLKVYFFYRHAVEVIVLVSPRARKKKVATLLLKAVLPLLEKENIHTLKFSFKKNKNKWLNTHDAHYEYTDYLLSHPLTTHKKCPHLIETALHDQIQDLLLLDRLCFTEPTLSQLRIEALLIRENYDIWIIKKNNSVIAKLHLQHHKTHSEIFDVAVHPDHQHQGYATALLNHAIEQAKKESKKELTLNVASNNKKALSLYLNNDFKVKSKKDYWSAPISLINALS